MAVIEVRELTKRYGELQAVRGVDLTVEPGEVFALLGPNGAGKTTTVEILEGYRSPTSGSVSVLGFDPEHHRQAFKDRIGIVLQESTVEPELTVREVIDVYGAVYSRRRRTGELIEIVGLEEKADARVGTLSGGQRRRLQMALGIVGDPDLIFLDEPTTGFDPSARRQAWGVIENLASLGKTILLTTHYMDEAQNLADRVAVIAAGQIVARGAPDTIGGRAQAKTEIRFTVAGASLDDLPLQPVHSVGSTVEIHSDMPIRDLNVLTNWALNAEVDLEGLTVTRPSLEDVYLELTGEDANPSTESG